MPLVLVRIDDRLIHGQVVVGWGKNLHPDLILLCSDEVANSEWQRNIYMLAVAGDIKASVLSVAETIENYHQGSYEQPKTILLAEDPGTIVRLVDGGLDIKSINIGGMHFQPGRIQIANFIFLGPQDVENFHILYQRGIKLEGRDVPTCASIDVAKILKFS